MKALELYAGLGGFAAAAGEDLEIVAALDASAHRLAVYGHNFKHRTVQDNLEGITPESLAAYDAALWWLSPPCQPYTVRGLRKDLDDPRSRSFQRIVRILPNLLPRCLALENVAGFQGSLGHALLIDTLNQCGYRYVERILCPTELGIPNRRPRYYLAATREGSPKPFQLERVGGRLADYLDETPDEALFIPPEIVVKYGAVFDCCDGDDASAVATCFTSAYGRSWAYSGSYLRHADGRVRFFSPKEILRLLHFPGTFTFPEGVGTKQQWSDLGDSLNVAAVRVVLRTLGCL